MNEFTMTSGTIKTMETFASTIKRCVELSLGDNYKVMVQESRKNNNVVLTGITIKEKGSKIAPLVYLGNAFESYKEGRSLAAICNDIIRVYMENREPVEFDEKDIADYERVKDRICYKLISAERNQSLLKEVPHIVFHDLAVVFFVQVFQNSQTTGTVTVTNDLIKLWKTDAFAIVKVAIKNTETMFEGMTIHMLDMLEQLRDSLFAGEGAEVFCDMSAKEVLPLYVATNATRMNGAAVLLYDNFLENFANEIGGSFYILPSSVHELIFVPSHPSVDIEYFKMMVKEINFTEVAPQEVLSDNIYFYDHADGLLMML